MAADYAKKAEPDPGDCLSELLGDRIARVSAPGVAQIVIDKPDEL